MGKKKSNNKKIQAAVTKKKIYDTAHRLFSEYGFDNVSVDSIVEMAGVSKGSFYVHFDSKYSLVAALIADYVNEVDLGYKSYFESFSADSMASDLIMSLINKIVDVITCTMGYDIMRILYEAHLTRTINTDSLLNPSRYLYKIFGNIINHGIRQGEFKKEIDVETITRHYVLAMRGLTYEWCIRYPDFDLRNQSLEHFEILLTGIKK
ncbi:TetR/AcrR family transcriptional regulator [Phosphitispora fastidiosa]|uniref:TetR/AcrR family transcriptional regulator n=1 Tax=Phosphitispora fastidiosa TaxID=2837202 RepID=UPI001E5CE055|nr:TetR/AcrR family transcriptional regulator [Phosphitispora fastidiosa]MBU7006902.1 AcrR family transcriptional regulator [Phosphitispora fastidiosa]